MMPKWALDRLAARITEDLRRATIISADAVLQDDGTIGVDELVLRMPDGREVSLVEADNRPGSAADLRLETFDPTLARTPSWGWRRMAVGDYGSELGEILAEGEGGDL